MTITLSVIVPAPERHPHCKTDQHVAEHGQEEQLHRRQSCLGRSNGKRCLADGSATKSVLPGKEYQRSLSPPRRRYCRHRPMPTLATAHRRDLPAGTGDYHERIAGE